MLKNHGKVLLLAAGLFVLTTATFNSPLRAGSVRAKDKTQAAINLEKSDTTSCLKSALWDLSGRQRQLGDSTARAYVLVFFSETCPICQKYSPWLRQFYERYVSLGVRVHLIFPDSSTTERDINDYRNKYRSPLSCLRDPQHQLTNCLDAKITPEAFVLDSAGTVRYRGRIDNLFVAPGRMRSVVSSHEVQDAVDAILSQRTVQIAQSKAIGCFIERR